MTTAQYTIKINNLIDLLHKKRDLKRSLKELETLIKPIQKELKPLREEHLSIINKKIFTKNMELCK